MAHDGGPPTEGDSPADAPLRLLADLGYPASNRFLPRVRSRIERRLLVAHVATGAWFVPLAVLLEFIHVAMSLFTSGSKPPKPSEPR